MILSDQGIELSWNGKTAAQRVARKRLLMGWNTF